MSKKQRKKDKKGDGADPKGARKDPKAAKKTAGKAGKRAGDCPGGKKCGKSRHLCRVAKKGDLDRVRQLVADAAYICRRCGRVARDKANLCRPEEL